MSTMKTQKQKNLFIGNYVISPNNPIGGWDSIAYKAVNEDLVPMVAKRIFANDLERLQISFQ